MYKIGEFSRLTKMTVKTLRYYDEEKLLPPSFRDAENGYRFYDDSDFEKANFITLLRELDFTIAEIKEVLLRCDGTDDFAFYLKEKQEMLIKQIKNNKKTIAKIQAYMPQNDKEQIKMNYEVTEKTIEPLLVATIRYKGRYDACGEYFSKIYAAIKNNADNPALDLCYETEYREDGADIEVCVPLKKQVSGNSISVKTLPKIKAISTIHTGSYDKFNFAYKALTDYAQAKGLKLGVPTRQIYHKGPGMLFKGNPDKYITEICIPIEDEQNEA